MRQLVRRFRNPHRTLTLAAGESGLIFEEELVDWEVGFWNLIANAYYGNTYYTVYVDDSVFEKVERVYGDIEDPFRFDPAVVFRKALRIYAFNNDSSSHVMEVYCNGEIYNEDNQ